MTGFDVDPELLRRRDAVLGQAMVLAEAPGRDFVPAGSRQYESKGPSGDSRSLFDRILEGFTMAKTEAMLRRAIYFAEREVHRVQKAEAVLGADGLPKETYNERSDRLLTDYVGCTPEEVSYWERGVTPAHMKRLRWQNGRRPEDGEVATGATLPWATPGERARRVKELKRAHPELSARLIAEQIGVTHPTVLADLKRPDEECAA